MNSKKRMLLPRVQPIRILWHGKRIFTAVLCLSILILIALPSQATAKHNFIAIGTGGSTGVYFRAGNAICLMLHKDMEDRGHNIRCIPASTGGSVDNINKVAAGELDFGIVQSDVQFHAYTGDASFTGAELKNIRAVLSLYSEAFHLLSRQGSGISNWDDLMGKRVNVGSPGSGIRSTFDELMGAYNVDTEFFGRATELTSSEQTHALCKGRIDAYGNSAGVPSPSVARAISDCGASIISLDTSVVRNLVAGRPYFDYLTIPAGTYANMERDIHTPGVIATVVTSEDMAESVVYELVRAVFENIDHLREVHPAFSDLDLQEMACRGYVAPLHDGAKKYFVEHGLDVCP